jgi:PEP-CTERM motif
MKSLFGAAATLFCVASPAAAAIVFSTDFETGVPLEVSGAGATMTSGGLPVSFGTTVYGNDSTGNPAAATTISLVGLAPHINMDISFDFIAYDSWDGSIGGYPYSDFFNLELDGVNVLLVSASNYGAVTIIPPTAVQVGAFAEYGRSTFLDSVYHVTLSGLTHSAATATLKLFSSGVGWQGGLDESWGIDNIEISTSLVAVPEPATIGLATLGLLGIGVARRRRRS